MVRKRSGVQIPIVAPDALNQVVLVATFNLPLNHELLLCHYLPKTDIISR